jgi:hypothetical protein
LYLALPLEVAPKLITKKYISLSLFFFFFFFFFSSLGMKLRADFSAHCYFLFIGKGLGHDWHLIKSFHYYLAAAPIRHPIKTLQHYFFFFSPFRRRSSPPLEFLSTYMSNKGKLPHEVFVQSHPYLYLIIYIYIYIYILMY